MSDARKSQLSIISKKDCDPCSQHSRDGLSPVSLVHSIDKANINKLFGVLNDF